MKKKVYQIFAIIGDPIEDADSWVFVDKSVQKNPNKILKYHLKNNKYIAEWVAGCNVHIHILDLVEGEARYAHRFVISYMRLFFENEYDVLGDDRLYEQSLALSSETQKIYNRISEISLQEMLSPKKETPAIEVSSVENPLPKQRLDARLSVRLTKREHKLFCEYCDALSLNQRDGFLDLLTRTGADSALVRRLQEQSFTINMQRERIQHLNQIVSNGSRGANADKKLVAAMAFAREGISRFADQFMEAPAEKLLRCMSWNMLTRSWPEWRKYRPPAEDAFFAFELENMCYSKSVPTCVFIFGRRLDTDEYVRLRFYDRREYVGLKPPSKHFYEGRRFLVGCQMRQSGACDMMFAVPLPYQEERQITVDDAKPEGSVNDIIDAATQRLKKHNP